MSGDWDAMVTAELAANNPQAGFETWRDGRVYGHVRYINNAARAWHAGIRWALDRQVEWETLTEGAAILELRRGVESIFYPLFAADPTIWGDCPRDGRTVVTAEGICTTCGFNFI